MQFADLIIPVAVLTIAVALIVAERRIATRQGRAPRTFVIVLAIILGVLTVFAGATAVLLTS